MFNSADQMLLFFKHSEQCGDSAQPNTLQATWNIWPGRSEVTNGSYSYY